MNFRYCIETVSTLSPPIEQPDYPNKLVNPTGEIKKKHIDKIRQLGTLKQGVFTPHQTLEVPREQMPQLKNREEFIHWLVTSHGVKVERILMSAKNLVKVNGEQLLAHAQKTMDLNKAVGFIKKQKILNKKIIISQDNIIFDGNHHWLALMLVCPKCPVEMYKVNMSFRELLELSKQFPGVTYEEWFKNYISLMIC